jgi:NAD-dependent dihydropyrimidine dehydrogenase PreA subunit/flavodoxin
MSTEIYYFSGTGNSLFVARELQKRLPDASIIPIVGLLGKKMIPTQGESVGLVFPAHARTIPVAVGRFVQKLDLKNSNYVFAVATLRGAPFHGFREIERLLKKKGRRLDGRFLVEMYGNDSRSAGYKAPGEADILAMERHVLEKLDAIKDIIIEKAVCREEDRNASAKRVSSPIQGFLIEKIAQRAAALSEQIGGANTFYQDDKCIGCGICEKVCLSGKIRLRDRTPFWEKGALCFRCFACINFCPKEAIQVRDFPGQKSHSGKNDRYPHPYATATVISRQKVQGETS